MIKPCKLIYPIKNKKKSCFMKEPELEAAAVLLRYPWVRPVRGYGTLLPHDGLPPSLRLLDAGSVHHDSRL